MTHAQYESMQLEISCLKRERDEARERNAHISRQLVEADDAMERQRTELTRLRGLLREALEAWHSAAYRRTFIDWRGNMEWGKKAQAALEGKP